MHKKSKRASRSENVREIMKAKENMRLWCSEKRNHEREHESERVRRVGGEGGRVMEEGSECVGMGVTLRREEET